MNPQPPPESTKPHSRRSAQSILHVVGLLFMAIAIGHFWGEFGVIGFLGWIFRYQRE